LFALPCASAKVQAFQNKTVAATGRRRRKRARVKRRKRKKARVTRRKRKKSPHLDIK